MQHSAELVQLAEKHQLAVHGLKGEVSTLQAQVIELKRAASDSVGSGLIVDLRAQVQDLEMQVLYRLLPVITGVESGGCVCGGGAISFKISTLFCIHVHNYICLNFNVCTFTSTSKYIVHVHPWLCTLCLAICIHCLTLSILS